MRRSIVLLLAAVVGLGACTELEPTAPDFDASFNRATAPGQQRLLGLDAEFARMAREVPGFGGMFVDEDGRLNVYMAPGQARKAATTQDVVQSIGRSLRARGRDMPAASEVVIRQADYDFLQLAGWNERMVPMLREPGIVFLDIDESRNRLRVGIEEGVSAAALAGVIDQLGVPAEAVEFEVATRFETLMGHSLQNRQQPLGGGLQLVMRHPTPGFVRLCTLGFNVLRDARGQSNPHFFTNSHCTETRGTVTDTEFFQQSLAQVNPHFLIGIEVEDPPFFTGGACFAGWICRWSDAALVRYVDRRTPVKMGAIYRTEFFGTGTSAGSLLVNEDEDEFFSIRAEADFPMVGDILNKVGRTTGWTRGPVIATCILTTPGSPVLMLCQDLVQAVVAGGDSGSPIFMQHGDSKDVTLYGILWGGGVSGGLPVFVFSAMENIRAEFGDFRTHHGPARPRM
jgi:hypothetical protein